MQDHSENQLIILPVFHQIRMPAPQDSMAVTFSDWDSLVERVRAFKVSTNFWAVAYSVAFGVAVTSGLSIIPIAFAQLPAWVLSTYIALCALGLGIGVATAFAERALAHDQQSEIDLLTAEMERMQSAFTGTVGV